MGNLRGSLVVNNTNNYSQVLGDVFTPDLTSRQRLGLDDATSAIERAVNRLTVYGGGTLKINGVLKCADSQFLPLNSNIEFTPGSRIKPTSGGQFIANALFLLNTTNGTSWTVPYPNIRGYGRGIIVDNSDDPGIVVGAIILGAGMLIENIYARACHFTVHNTANYIDQIRINGSMSESPQGSLWPIELNNTGDGLSIRAAHCYLFGGNPKHVRLNACQGGEIQGSIGGDVYLNQCSGLKFHGGHHETGQLSVDGSDCSIEDSVFWVRDIPSIRFISNAGGERRVANLKTLNSYSDAKITPQYHHYMMYKPAPDTIYHSTMYPAPGGQQLTPITLKNQVYWYVIVPAPLYLAGIIMHMRSVEKAK